MARCGIVFYRFTDAGAQFIAKQHALTQYHKQHDSHIILPLLANHNTLYNIVDALYLAAILSHKRGERTDALALFERVARPLGVVETPGCWLAGRRMVAIDAMTLDVADSEVNAAEFGRPGVNKGEQSAFPQARVVAVAECGTRAMFDAVVGPYTTGENTLAVDLVERHKQVAYVSPKQGLLHADIIITATGFNLCVMGDIAFDIDGEPVDFADTFTYRGIMNSGLPNMAMMFGYLRTSWTMRVDLVCDFVCKLLNKMEEEGASVCTPTLREQDQDMAVRPWIEDDEFNAGYLQRSMHLLPHQGGNQPKKSVSSIHWFHQKRILQLSSCRLYLTIPISSFRLAVRSIRSRLACTSHQGSKRKAQDAVRFGDLAR